MKAICELCQKVLYSVENIKNKYKYDIPSICKDCFDRVMREGTEQERKRALQLIKTRDNPFYNQ